MTPTESPKSLICDASMEEKYLLDSQEIALDGATVNADGAQINLDLPSLGTRRLGELTQAIFGGSSQLRV
ncbi:hypothetical protein [Microbacterium suwonense]|uniref:Uncharacterized protein n=1 Tax=Microbacterium suwonense TaxID=683047 RepID=A0ABN6X040_9MICO|nr:hypothetical protein [Microbacterium suwonense]BDZ37441.1 hypothetical protein GCM10025863_00550 [Microbacterium suwonense]